MESSFDSRGVDYGHALAAVKNGECIARVGWNGKGMCVFMRPADDLPVSFLPKVKSLPESIKQRLQARFNGDTHYTSGEEITVSFNAYLCMLAADGSIVNGWLPSQTDMLATDWLILD
jgi:hypothetical protein